MQRLRSPKKKRIMLKVKRTKDARCRKEWSKKHGHGTYGYDEDSDTAELKPKKKEKSKKGQKAVERMCTTHGPPIRSAPSTRRG